MIVLETELYFECTLEIQTLFHLLLLETYQSDTISLVRFLLHMLQILDILPAIILIVIDASTNNTLGKY